MSPEPVSVLIVDDQAPFRSAARAVLALSPGFAAVAEADSGEAAVAAAAELTPALVLMDIHLPGIDGIEALRRLRADAATRSIPVIAVTASAMTHDRQKILAAGFDGYQSKPISVRPFLAAVREALDRAAGRA
jgi:two-component system cell cycle response regulator DivK